MDIICDKKPTPDFDVSPLLSNKDTVCVVEHARSILEYASRESCGKCVFCREGTLQLSEILRDSTEGRGQSDDLELLADVGTMVKENAGCVLARGAASALLSLMETYPDEFEQHIKRKRCSALVCKTYFTVHILADRCQGCEKCLSVCPENAIAGGPGMIHVVDQDRCTRCGVCIDTCLPLYDAIQKAGPVKPRTPDAPVPVGAWEDPGGRRRRRRGVE